MIDIRELRIGNYIGYYSYNENDITIDKIKSIYFDDTTQIYKVELASGKYAHSNISLQGLVPIPLTEDILLKCGFILTEKEGFSCSDDVQSDKGYSFKNFNISMRDGRFFMWIDIDEDHWYSFNMVEIKYLHRLQNIFFEHCNEELNIKL
jgi:hypothetical protein